MIPRTMLCVDDFPDYILAGFRELCAATGRYPCVLVVGALLGEMMDAEPGEWRPSAFGGMWCWAEKLAPHGTDEFGNPE